MWKFSQTRDRNEISGNILQLTTLCLTKLNSKYIYINCISMYDVYKARQNIRLTLSKIVFLFFSLVPWYY